MLLLMKEVHAMSDSMDLTQKIYNAGDVAQLLEVKDSTVRKYAQTLEKAGYKFYKNENGYRGYFDKDVIAMRHLIQYSKHPDMTLESAAKAVVSTNIEGDIQGVDTVNEVAQELPQAYDDLLKEFQIFKEQQMEFNKELISKIEQRDQYISERLEKRDNALMDSIRLIQEQKQLEHAASEENNKWWQFWTKKKR
ncbi:DNA-binding protein [Bacillus pseudomycoides]|nr:DNA-binding protein [Bacillus toyonensis]PEJ72066.1 DNA-binding protein [Bacillus pseudomycoides]PFV62625.1 DNA-binding protein [Bacillus cereus]